jgi:hypothetical protein
MGCLCLLCGVFAGSGWRLAKSGRSKAQAVLDASSFFSLLLRDPGSLMQSPGYLRQGAN